MNEELVERVARAVQAVPINAVWRPFGIVAKAELPDDIAQDIATAAIAAVRTWDVLHGPSASEIEAGVREYDNWSCVQNVLEAAAVERACGEGARHEDH